MGKAKSKEMLFWTKEEYSTFIEAMIRKPVSYYAFELLYDGESAVATLPAKHYNYVNYVVDKFRKYLDDNDTLYYKKTTKIFQTF